GAALRFDRAADLVEADEGERVAIDVFESREDAAPRGTVLPCRRMPRRSVGVSPLSIVDDPSKAWRASEPNAASSPLGVGGGYVLRHEDHLRRPSDEPGLGRLGADLDQRENCRAVGRSDGQQALTRPDTRVEGNPESERVEIEVKAALLILDVDVH